MLSGGRYFKKYINLGKVIRQRGDQWIKTSEMYPDMCTAFRTIATGFGDGVTMGTIKCTWYVSFKGLNMETA